MPIFDRLTGSPGKDDEQLPLHKTEPDVIQGRPGYASFSVNALRELIVEALQEELVGRTDILLDAQAEADRRALVQQTGEYVLAVESVPLTHAERASLFDMVYSDVFGLGPLEPLLADETVTEVIVDGPDSVHVRRAMGDPEPVGGGFEDDVHLAQVVERMMTGGGTRPRDDCPFVEVGLVLQGRPARLSLVGPPLSPVLHADLRLHPRVALTLDTLAEQSALTEVEVTMLKALAASPHGVLFVGDVGAGKTTLLGTLLDHLPDPASCWLVERATEGRPPIEVHRLAAGVTAEEDAPEPDFAAQIQAALAAGAGTLALDEVRGDEAAVLWQVLAAPQKSRCLWVLRSSTDPERLYSAITILLRKGRPDVTRQALHDALLDRLPFVVTTHLEDGVVRVEHIAAWRESDSGEALTLLPLVEAGAVTGHEPPHVLNVPTGFWSN